MKQRIEQDQVPCQDAVGSEEEDYYYEDDSANHMNASHPPRHVSFKDEGIVKGDVRPCLVMKIFITPRYEDAEE